MHAAAPGGQVCLDGAWPTAFLRSFSDEEMMRFAEERASLRPPHWRYLRLALRMEAYRRGLELDEAVLGAEPTVGSDRGSRVGASD